MNLDQIGPWSEIKLAILRDYVATYTQILSSQSFLSFYYIDAFAGAGKHERRSTGETISGSPRLAIEISKPFDKYWFIDLNKGKTLMLDEIRLEHPELDIEILQGDCNEILIESIFPQIKYSDYKRALCILDPYGLDLDWMVVATAGRMKSIEIFLNFPLMDMNMNVLWRKNPKGADSAQIERMDRFWGDDSWREVAYEPEPAFDLFERDRKVKVPDANSALVKAFRKRLRSKAGFNYVPVPIPMRNTTNAEIYYLFFASPNKTGHKVVIDIFNKYRG